MRVPTEIENIILDYWWSHHTFKKKQRLHMHLRHLWMLEEVRIFYDLFYSPLGTGPIPFASLPPDFFES